MQGSRDKKGNEQEKKEQNEGGSASAKKNAKKNSEEEARKEGKKTSVKILLGSKGFKIMLKTAKKKNNHTKSALNLVNVLV